MLIFLVVLVPALLPINLSAPAATTPITCKTGNGTKNRCGIHVFRVALSNRPEERGGIVEVKPKRKYGNNVYAPRNSADSFVVKEVFAAMPSNIDPKVKDRIKDADFVMKPEEPIWLNEHDTVPTNFQPMKPPVATSSQSPPAVQPQQTPTRLSTIYFFLILGLGLVFGICCTFVSFLLYKFCKSPMIDSGDVITYKKITEIERRLRERQQRLLQQRRLQMTRMSSAQSNASSRTAPGGARRQKRDNLSLATSRDSRDVLME